MGAAAIVGVNWGDEGKGRMVDLISRDYDIVIRYQGGNNAGHTVVNDYGKFALNLLPSGIFRPEVTCVLGSGVVVDPCHLCGEIKRLQEKGVHIGPDNLKISDRAHIVFPYHRDLDGLEEARLADKAFGSTKRGIAPVYSDKFQKKGIMMGELRNMDKLRARLTGILEWKNLTLENIYHAKTYTVDELMAWLEEYGRALLPHICDTGVLLREAEAAGKKILFEAQLGTLRDIDFGIYPMCSSSNPIAAYAPIGCGAPWIQVNEVIGVVKAYSSCVGEGPFTAEWFGEDADKLREAGAEYGAATGRPRRVGPVDIVATRYGARMQGATCIALTKMDILSYMDEIPVCQQYEVNGEVTDEFPFPSELPDAKPVMTKVPGWKCDISGVRKWEDLPKAAQDYVLYIEKEIGFPIKYVSVGAERDAIIVRD